MISLEIRGFEDPVHHSQAWFRAVLVALSRPGRPITGPTQVAAPAPLLGSAAAIGLSLFDTGTPVWVDPDLRRRSIEDYFRYYSDASLVDGPDRCQFAIISDAKTMPSLATFPSGTAEYPNTSATLIVQLPDLQNGAEVTLQGPGIDGNITVSPNGLARSFWDQWDVNTAGFPLGVDLVLTDGYQLLGLPRTSRRV